MNTTKATLRTFERALPNGRWRAMSEPEPANVGVNGLGWAPTFKHLARDKEPLKHERDGRAPAGIFRFGKSFGFEPVNNKDHLRLQPGVHFCVEDVRSPYYGHIVAKSKLGQKVSGEEMAAIDTYRRGLVIDYPRRRFAKAGSCIFLHVWESPDKGSSGRVGLPEERVAHFQTWAKNRHTVIAIVPDPAVDRFDGCLPLNTQVSRNDAPVAVPVPNPMRQGRGAATVTTQGSSTPSSGTLAP
jgi:L,D-peptidoglycan transpeptidase YkuD (ErfK/YbiS/YcfS/YnhG family)